MKSYQGPIADILIDQVCTNNLTASSSNRLHASSVIVVCYCSFSALSLFLCHCSSAVFWNGYCCLLLFLIGVITVVFVFLLLFLQQCSMFWTCCCCSPISISAVPVCDESLQWWLFGDQRRSVAGCLQAADLRTECVPVCSSPSAHWVKCAACSYWYCQAIFITQVDQFMRWKCGLAGY